MLPKDVSRCVGKRSLQGSAETCPKRNACERYIALHRYGLQSIPITTPVSMWMCSDERYEHQIEPVTHGKPPPPDASNTHGH